MDRISHMGEVRNAYDIFVGKPEEKKLPGIIKRRWEDNIKLHLKEIGRECVD
jgi:hypothetical protein